MDQWSGFSANHNKLPHQVKGRRILASGLISLPLKLLLVGKRDSEARSEAVSDAWQDTVGVALKEVGGFAAGFPLRYNSASRVV